jgi:multidrug efflux pump subunit AcrA (membrane-fusion protein)
MRIAWLALFAALPLAAWGLAELGPSARAQSPGRHPAARSGVSAGHESPRLPGPISIPGQVMVLQQAQVSALEAGMIAGLEAYEGLVVEAGQELGRLDDDRTQIEKKLAEFDREIAEKHSSDDVNVRFAKAAHEVAVAELNQGNEANKKVANAVPASEIRRRALAAERARLQIAPRGLRSILPA